MKSIKIFIFLMAVCTLCFCSLSLHAQTQRELTLKALTRRDWIWQVNTNFLIYYHLIKIRFLFWLMDGATIHSMPLIILMNTNVAIGGLILIIFLILFLLFLNMRKLVI